MSASGVFINTSVKAEPGTSATVVFMVPGQKTPFKLKGKVVRTEEGGVAIWFSEMTNYAQKALGKLLLA
ncbi:MAG: PilZ domain-containing protein [Desulfobacter sp.]|nr:PilZ domain-containing protein [Desulfobacter sp.]